MSRTAIALCGVWLVACSGEPAPSSPDPGAEQVTAESLISDGPHDVAVMEVRGLGRVRIELYPELAPKTVEYFTKLAREHTYDGMTFHRVIPGFMIQGGDPNSRDDKDPRNDGDGGGAWLQNEFSAFPHQRGTVSLANRGRKNSGGSQFFVVHQDSPHLDGRFNAFGRVIEGIEVIDRITEVEIDTYGRFGRKDRPHPEDVIIESIRLESEQISQNAR